ncbi:hypothetical protein E3E22_07380 [Thermococcus sp. MV5]|uniref:hypothetical protein n=1 Tax=Thermococcus sp. MV5 TaxID=1638272 RepID=UPI001439B543|nr:hypothetical protein [Thermococcus sp. MV5]NJE26438.1 hypothetical protein [Thermococcus sp. MV5]
MKHEMFITTFQNGRINIHRKFYSIPATETSYERIRGEYPVKLIGVTRVISDRYYPNLNVIHDIPQDSVRIKETESFQSLHEDLRKNSKAAVESLMELIRPSEFGIIELDADEYGEAKIVVYLRQRMAPREEVKLIRRAFKAIRKKFPGERIHIVVDYLDRVSKI